MIAGTNLNNRRNNLPTAITVVPKISNTAHLQHPFKLFILWTLISMAVKITSLLAQYLYTNHRLDLPGIGTFLLDPSAISSLENTKQRSAVLEGVSFESNPQISEVHGLVAFISSQTGKMKALAQADLESHIQLVDQFLNIGKPFTFEGIGTLVRKKQGEYEFTPLAIATEKIKEYKIKEPAPVSLEESSAQYESFLAAPKTRIGWGKPAIALLVLAGLGLAIWGGYTISRKAASNDITVIPENITTPRPAVAVVDTIPVKKDTVTDYKYVLQVSPMKTAFRRYNQLRTNQWNVKMETSDSVSYKLYLLLPRASADTTHILDSLTAMTGKKVYIEAQN